MPLQLPTRALSVVAALLLSGCGSSSGDAALRADVADVVTAANQKDESAARRALERLRQDAGAAERAGRITRQQAVDLLDAARAVDVSLGRLVVPPSRPDAGPTQSIDPGPGATRKGEHKDDEDKGESKDGD